MTDRCRYLKGFFRPRVTGWTHPAAMSSSSRTAASKKTTSPGTPRIAGMTSKASSDDKRNLALLLSELGRYHEALPFWQELALTTVLTPDTRRLLDCALRLGQQGLALDVCRMLRQSGIEDSDLFETEVGILERYDPDGAVELIQEKLRHRSDDKTLRLHLSVIGLRIGRMDIISGDPSEIPSASEVPPHRGRAAVWVMRMTGHPEEAVRYAYDLLRRHFGDIEANRAYRASMDPIGPLNIPFPDVIGRGTAVSFVEEGTTTERWVIIEDAFEPDVEAGRDLAGQPSQLRILTVNG